MGYPDFYDSVPKITLYDPLSEFLGATEGGMLQYGYFDAVRLAGHSCPTVASAYWSTHKALNFLYPDMTPVRGDIRAEFGQSSTAGVTGVIANVVSMLTGAMSDNGFKGLGGRFDRRNRLFFEVEISGEMRFIRLDNNRTVSVSTRLQKIPASPYLPELMANCMSGTATREETAQFRILWQERVRSILLDYCDDPEVFVVMPG